MITVIISAIAFTTFAILGQIALAELVSKNQTWFGYDDSGEYGLPPKHD